MNLLFMNKFEETKGKAIIKITCGYHISDMFAQRLMRRSYEMKISNHHNHKEHPEELQFHKVECKYINYKQLLVHYW